MTRSTSDRVVFALTLNRVPAEKFPFARFADPNNCIATPLTLAKITPDPSDKLKFSVSIDIPEKAKIYSWPDNCDSEA